MRKFLVGLLLAVGLLVPVSVFTAPAAHAVTCNDVRVKSDNMAFKVNLPYHDDSTHVITFKLKYRFCETASGAPLRADIYGYQILTEQSSGLACGQGGNHTDWRMNPNVIGSWNLEERQKPCDHNVSFTWGSWDALQVVTVVKPDDAESAQCLGTHITAVQYLVSDTERDSPSICLYTGL